MIALEKDLIINGWGKLIFSLSFPGKSKNWKSDIGFQATF
jgi:hypothetical protein